MGKQSADIIIIGGGAAGLMAAAGAAERFAADGTDAKVLVLDNNYIYVDLVLTCSALEKSQATITSLPIILLLLLYHLNYLYRIFP